MQPPARISKPPLRPLAHPASVRISGELNYPTSDSSDDVCVKVKELLSSLADRPLFKRIFFPFVDVVVFFIGHPVFCMLISFHMYVVSRFPSNVVAIYYICSGM